MSTSEKILQEIFDDNRWIQKVLIGSLLSFIPIINFFVFGYLYRYSRNVADTGSFELPEWDDWASLFEDGLHFFIVALLYFLIPLGIAMILAMVIGAVTLGLLWWIPVAIVYMAGPPIVLAVLHRLKGEMNWGVLIDLRAHLSLYTSCWTRFLFPTLAFIGLQVIAFPLYGFTFFLGFVPYVAYAIYVFTDNVKSK